jgi:poly(A) polymerase Pap1
VVKTELVSKLRNSKARKEKQAGLTRMLIVMREIVYDFNFRHRVRKLCGVIIKATGTGEIFCYGNIRIGLGRKSADVGS